jgi:hypothetical protein
LDRAPACIFSQLPKLITSQQDGKPYILYNEAKQIQNTHEPVHDGYTICSLTFFASKADHDYYDKECAAHQELRKVTASRRTGVCVTVSETDLGPKL